MATYDKEQAVAGTELLDELLEPYRRAVQDGLKALTESKYRLGDAAYEFMVSGGKRLRSSIVLLGCEAVSGTYKQAMPIALAYELAHSASLTQDDIIDDSPVRHNRPSAHTKHGVTTAILISDMLLFEIFEQLGRYAEFEISKDKVARLIKYVAVAAKETAEGEYLEMQFSKKLEPTVEDYVRLAGLKTGALFGAAAASGGVVGGASQRITRDLSLFGRNLGISFQMMDDVLDMTGKSEEMGKPLLKDIQNNVSNIVLIHALSRADPRTRNQIRSMMLRSNYGLLDVVELLGVLDDIGSVEYADRLCLRHASMARARLKSLPDTKAKETLEEMTRWLEGRRR